MLNVSEIVAKTEEMFNLFNHHFYNDELTRPAITVSPDGGRGAYGWCSVYEIWQASGEAYREINICAEYMEAAETEGKPTVPIAPIAQDVWAKEEMNAEEQTRRETIESVTPDMLYGQKNESNAFLAGQAQEAADRSRDQRDATDYEMKRVEKSAKVFDDKTAGAFITNYQESNTTLDAGTYYGGFLHAYAAAKQGKYKDYEGYAKENDPVISIEAGMAAWNGGIRARAAEEKAAKIAASETGAPPIFDAQKPTVSAPSAAEPPAKAGTPGGQIAQTLLTKYIDKGTAFNSAVLFQTADAAYGGTQAAGAYSPKDAYDAMELAVNKKLLTMAVDMNGDAKSAVRALNRLTNLLDKLPTQTKRTQEQQDYQQFSTPPNIAYLAAWLGNVSNTDVVLEPSAGIGGIATFAKAWGATVAVNELSDRRRALLDEMGFDRVFGENAEQLNNVLPADVKPTVVLMNPPFSSTAGRMARNSTQNATRHIEQALLRLEDGGRLVAVLGKGMADDAPAFQAWFKKIRQNYAIRANIQIDGSNYRKYGTTWDVQLMVVDKTGAQKGETITGVYKDLKAIPAELEGIRNGRSSNLRATEPNGVVAGSAKAPEGQGTLRAEAGSVSPSGDRKGAYGKPVKAAAVRTSAGEGVIGKPDVQLPVQSEGTVQVSNGEPGYGDGRIRPNDGTEPGGLVEQPGELVQPTTGVSRTAVKKKKAPQSDDGVYAEYVPAPLPIKGAKKHPAPLVESAAMAAVQTPKATYKPNLPANLIERGAISAAQLENIVYAGQAHSQTLPDWNRKGYFIGDGTGVGKGRQISGIILDNFRQGRKKAVWVSKNLDLLPDAMRDWSDIGGNKDDVVSQALYKLGTPIGMKQGILFTGYDTLRSEKGADTRLNQIVNWLGKDFDGVIAFDEAHNMGNLLGKMSARGKTKGSAKAAAGVELQKLLPNARVIYVSATGATDVNELAYAERLGLWGKGTAFPSVNDFVQKIGSSGLSAMELVARDMKAMGVYLARSISYNGVNYDTLQHTLTPMQREIYDTMCEAWQVTLKNINKALEVTGGDKNPNARGAAKSAYYGAMQRFYNQILTSMSMPSVIKDIQKELDAGHSIVLQIVNTNEAETNRQLADAKKTGKELDELDLTPRGVLLGYLNNAFPTQAYEEYTDDKGDIRSRPVTDSKGNPVIDQQAVSMRDAMIDRVTQMSVPDGPMEMLFDAFGTENVAEVTGRTRRVAPRKNERGQMVRVEETRSSRHAMADVDAFQNGDKRILVFSDAGGTGKSYHADLRAKNQQTRVHYLIQPGWSASKATQGFGRTHRSNQAQPPLFKLVTTDVMGQKRFVSTIARRLDQLGALTKGQRETGSGMFGAKDNLESALAKDSLRAFYDLLGHNRIDGMDAWSILDKLGLKDKFSDEYGSFKLPDEASRDMNLFLNRILALGVDEQNKVFGAFYDIFEGAYDKAMENGTLDMGMETVRADKVEIVDNQEIRVDEATGAATRYVQAKTYRKPVLIQTVEALEKARGHFTGLYKTDKGDVCGVYQIADKTMSDGKVHKMYRMQSPAYSRFGTWSDTTLAERAKELPRSEWKDAWKSEIAKQPEYTESTVHMLTGALLPVWNLLPQEGNTKAMRIIADNGDQYLGRVIPPTEIDGVLQRLGGAGRTKETYAPADLMARVLSGQKVQLMSDRMGMKRSRVSGEYRVELTGQNLWFLPRQYPDIITERIDYNNRYFIPTGEKGERLLGELIKTNPVASVGDGNDIENLIATDPSKQEVKSSATSINAAKLPVLYGRVDFKPGTVNLDIGGGRFDNVTEYLKERGVTSYIYDPYNRTQEHNQMAANATQEGQSDTVTISNCMNVIREPEARAEVLANAVDAVKPGGTVYITVYEGDGKGVGAATTKGWQENRLTSSYLPETKKFFRDVTVKNKVIVCKDPKKAKAVEYMRPAINQNNEFGLETYTYHERSNWSNNNSIIIATSKENVRQFVADALQRKTSNQKLYFGKIGVELSQRIQESVGLNLYGYNCTLRASEIHKILNDHGDEGKEALRGQRAITVDDFIEMTNVITNADSILRSAKDYEGKPTIIFSKSENGKFTVVAYVSGKHLDLTIQTAYATKKGSLSTTPRGSSYEPDAQTSETLSGTASDTSITQQPSEMQENWIGATGGADQWTATRVGQERPVLTIDAILDKARRHFDLPISGGHIRGSDIRGQYNGQAKTVRTKITNDLPAAFHEIGHHLNREYKLVRNMPLNVKKEVTRALSEAMQERYGDNLGQMWSEAFAEYLRQYMQNSETARIDYPLTTAYMQEKLYADTMAFVNELADDVNAYYSLSADDATAEVISRAESEKDGRGVAEILHGAKEKAYQDWVDQNHGIRVFDKATGANAYTLASNSAYADAVAGQILTGDLTDPDGRYVAPGLRDALSSVDMTDKNEYAAFGEYLVCRHGPERLAEGMRVFANDAKNSSASTWSRRRAWHSSKPLRGLPG